MIQNFEETVRRIADGEGIPGGEVFIPRLCETLSKFGSEVLRDLQMPEWQSQVDGGLNAAYILCFLGKGAEAERFLERSIEIHRARRNEYSESESSVLEFVVRTLEDFSADEEITERYRLKPAVAREREVETPEDLRRKVIHAEADMECAEGDLNEIHAQGWRERGLLLQRAGDHREAIASFRRSTEEDDCDREHETTIKNSLSIVDSLLALDEADAARDEFTGLLKILAPVEIEIGDALPGLFVENFSALHPYFERLEFQGGVEDIARYAAARLKKIKPEDHVNRMEICRLTEILAVFCIDRGDYQTASDLFDAGRVHLEYKNHLSRRKQAEFAIRAGNPDKARELIREEDLEKGSGFDRDDKVFDMANLDLQLGNISAALDRLDGYCERYKKSLFSGSYGNIFETRQAEIAVMKGAIGPDSVQRVRDRIGEMSVITIDANTLPLLEGPEEEEDL